MEETKETIEKLKQADVLSWCRYNNLLLKDGVPFELSGMPYLMGLVNCDKRVVSVKKGSQVCITTSKFLETVHACYYRVYNQNIIYMLPTVRQAELLSKVSFDPIFNYNGWLRKKLSVNNASLKTINGRSIVFVGAQSQKVGDSTAKDSVNLRSIAADAVYRDEIDLMDEDMVELSKQRLNRSKFRIECNFGSPTVPGYGIDMLYEEGDRRRWMIRCSCGKYTSLAEEFPRSIIKTGGRWHRSCVHCHNEIFVKDGEWVAENPESRTASFWVDGLISPLADLEEYMIRYEKSDGRALSEFERSILGRAVIEASCQLSEKDVLSKCRLDGLRSFSDGTTCMGIDVGEKMHYVVGHRDSKNTFEILSMGTATDFGLIHDIARKMKVKMTVIDKGPDIFGVKEYQKNAGHRVFRCLYNEHSLLKPTYDTKTGLVKANRNEVCDMVHDTFINGMITIPRKSAETSEYAVQMTKTAKDTSPHPDTGIPRTRWIKVGNKQDHYFHATGYFLLAANRVSPTGGINRNRRLSYAINNYERTR